MIALARTDRDDGAARELVLAYGSSATAYQILNPGIRHWFAPDGGAVVGFVPARDFLVAAGSPVCATERLDAVRDGFERMARDRGLRVCWFGVEAPFVSRVGPATGHAAFRLGAQPVWDPSRWADGLRSHASLRAQLHRAANKAVAVREWPVREEPASDAMRRCLSEWLVTRGAPPMHFLVEPETLGELRDRRVFVAERAAETIGFLVASPVPRRQGWLIEQIIRGAAAVNGTSELLVDAAMRALAADGAAMVTLGMSPLSVRGPGGDAAPPWWLHGTLRWVRAHGRRFYNFEGLDAFKAKLGPATWEPLHAVTDRPRVSPAVLLAIAGAFTEGAPFAATARALAWALGQEVRGALDRPFGSRYTGPSPR